VDVVQELRAAGHGTLDLPNMPAPFARMLRDNGFTSLFDGGVFSCDTGHVKPEPAIFAAAQEVLGLDLAVTTFVDDRQVNVDAARAAGWDAVLFTGPDDVRDRLLAYSGG
jgi:FMN phosphatase YigB (HAD superfamily)